MMYNMDKGQKTEDTKCEHQSIGFKDPKSSTKYVSTRSNMSIKYERYEIIVRQTKILS